MIEDTRSVEDCHAGNRICGFPDAEMSPEDEAAMYRHLQLCEIVSTYTVRAVYAKRMRRWQAWVSRPGEAATHDAGMYRREAEAMEAAERVAFKLAAEEFDRPIRVA